MSHSTWPEDRPCSMAHLLAFVMPAALPGPLSNRRSHLKSDTLSRVSLVELRLLQWTASVARCFTTVPYRTVQCRTGCTRTSPHLRLTSSVRYGTVGYIRPRYCTLPTVRYSTVRSTVCTGLGRIHRRARTVPYRPYSNRQFSIASSRLVSRPPPRRYGPVPGPTLSALQSTD